jgi:beta-lactamase regulating signal transducer with metallopeptidase domain
MSTGSEFGRTAKIVRRYVTSIRKYFLWHRVGISLTIAHVLAQFSSAFKDSAVEISKMMAEHLVSYRPTSCFRLATVATASITVILDIASNLERISPYIAPGIVLEV